MTIHDMSQPARESCGTILAPRATTYLAARYGRLKEMQGCRDQLERIGIAVRANWVKGEDKDDARYFDHYALQALSDIDASDLFITFTEDPRYPIGGQTNGGRHVELGYAGAKGKRIIVVGCYENIFHYLPGEHFPTWEQALVVLASEVVAEQKYAPRS